MCKPGGGGRGRGRGAGLENLLSCGLDRGRGEGRWADRQRAVCFSSTTTSNSTSGTSSTVQGSLRICTRRTQTRHEKPQRGAGSTSLTLFDMELAAPLCGVQGLVASKEKQHLLLPPSSSCSPLSSSLLTLLEKSCPRFHSATACEQHSREPPRSDFSPCWLLVACSRPGSMPPLRLSTPQPEDRVTLWLGHFRYNSARGVLGDVVLKPS